MAEILNTFKSFLKLKEVNRDNVVFKLFSSVSVGLCFLGSVIVAATQYFGDPINCDHSTYQVDGGTFRAHCWIHGSKIVDKKYQSHFDCVAHPRDEHDGNDTIYYQWVVFMLAINGIIFMLPNQIWRAYEGGLIKGFYSPDAKSAFIACKNEAARDLTSKFSEYFRSLKGQHLTYFGVFFLCELLNLAAVAANFVINDKFLDGNFNSYGKDVLDYQSLGTFERNRTVNPMCNAFPTKVSCVFKRISLTGQEETISGICILSQNIINEKIYFALWFWFIVLFFVGTAQILFQICIITLPSLRRTMLASQLGTSYYNERLRYFLSNECNVGDWFLLHQIGKNTDKYFFKEFINDLTSKSALLKNEDQEEQALEMGKLS